MRAFCYVVEHDKGFAPNPFFGVCSLAACKPLFRQKANEGDVILGFGSAKHGIAGQLIYWMLIDEITSFDKYWQDPRFRRKRPQMKGSLMLCYGDNLYHRDPVTGAWIQEPSFHSDPPNLINGGNLERDTGRTERVLLARDYAYWGGSGPKLPPELEEFVVRGRGDKCRFPEQACGTLLEWLQKLPDRGICGEPADWQKDPNLK